MYRVFSISRQTQGSDDVLETLTFKEAVDWCTENFVEGEDGPSDYVIYDSENVLIWDTYSKSRFGYGVMGTGK